MGAYKMRKFTIHELQRIHNEAIQRYNGKRNNKKNMVNFENGIYIFSDVSWWKYVSQSYSIIVDERYLEPNPGW